MAFEQDRALVRIESERYIAALRHFTHGMTESLKHDVLLTSGFELLRRIQQRTPVDTSRARNSWHLVPPGTSDSHSYSDRQGRSFDGSLGVTTGPLEVAVGSNVPYMIALEAGTSKQAPGGMVAVSLAEIRVALIKKGSTAITAAWRKAR